MIYSEHLFEMVVETKVFEAIEETKKNSADQIWIRIRKRNVIVSTKSSEITCHQELQVKRIFRPCQLMRSLFWWNHSNYVNFHGRVLLFKLCNEFSHLCQNRWRMILIKKNKLLRMFACHNFFNFLFISIFEQMPRISINMVRRFIRM